jgi:hypothetical protein
MFTLDYKLNGTLSEPDKSHIENLDETGLRRGVLVILEHMPGAAPPLAR